MSSWFYVIWPQVLGLSVPVGSRQGKEIGTFSLPNMDLAVASEAFFSVFFWVLLWKILDQVWPLKYVEQC